MAFSTHDIVPDSPTNNFCTLNPLIGLASTLSDGNLYSTISGVNHGAIPNFALPLSGIWYTEFKFHSIPSGYPAVGLSVNNKIGWNTAGSETDPQSLTYNGSGGTYNFEEYGTAFSFSNEVDNINAVINTTNVYALYWNADTNKLTLYDGTNTASVDVTVNTTEPISFIYAQSAGATYTVSVNFGQDPTFGGAKSPTTTYTDANGIGAFYYQPPAGSKALCTANLPEMTPTVTGDVPQDYFKTVLYTGNGSTQSITGVGFQSDFFWLKGRSYAEHHHLYDVVRGATQVIYSNRTVAEATDTLGLTSFDADGFSIGSRHEINNTGNTFVAWCMKAGGAPQADNSNTSGAMTANSVSLNGTLQSNYTPAGSPTIYPTRMSINTDAGFSIVKYGGSNTTGLLSSSVSSATIPHGLNDCEFCIIKNIKWSNTWVVSHRSIASNVMALQSTGEADPTPPVDPTYGQITTLGSNTVTITRGTSRGDNVGEDHAETNGQFEYIMYCWHSVENYSKFGSYTGNGSADGPFIYCGFRPAFVICKCSSDTTTDNTSWAMFDNARDSSNVMNKVLYANSTINEGYRGDGSTAATDIYIDFLSNGFKVRSTKEEVNDANETYIFMAFAEQPFKFSNAR